MLEYFGSDYVKGIYVWNNYSFAFHQFTPGIGVVGRILDPKKLGIHKKANLKIGIFKEYLHVGLYSDGSFQYKTQYRAFILGDDWEKRLERLSKDDELVFLDLNAKKIEKEEIMEKYPEFYF